MDIKELSESICSFVNYDGRSPLTENDITLIYEFKKNIFGDEIEFRDIFTEILLKNYKHQGINSVINGDD
ncbi:hypothetical protein BV921_22395 [Pectobacterium odoriferum]|uniref:Uncharacterized protein n=1 Tax=Pectobacterium odoriferum TaxID=78398 RepID=A0ABD6VID4_9GAMM|nr:hypothetical protein BVY06_23000 [Pectobacterium odoriferum]POE06883.1 hypothetical protein BV921_22395 [Pectobacterium odoriferum]POE07577.1 hypothetical protein BV924_22915 [Pectobacterium odoriferum]POE21709.1 hypothetical protein BV926_22825 [Pectobacterium odoriferum]POE26294.1 hypothetical protein BV919_22850 [Pectobacterium odoriferum]